MFVFQFSKQYQKKQHILTKMLTRL